MRLEQTELRVNGNANQRIVSRVHIVQVLG